MYKCLDALSEYWESEFGVTAPIVQSFSSEVHTGKQEFLKRNFPRCQALFATIDEVR